MNERLKKNLEDTIDKYQEENSKKQFLEKSLKEKNTFIKSTLTELQQDVYETEKSKATLTYQNKVSMDDDKCIEILREHCKEEDLKNVIKTKEYVDYEALESLIYNGGIDAVKLEPAQMTKTVIALTVKPLKKKEEENE